LWELKRCAGTAAATRCGLDYFGDVLLGTNGKRQPPRTRRPRYRFMTPHDVHTALQNLILPRVTAYICQTNRLKAGHSLASKPIHAAGGIVVRNGPRPRFAIVQRSKDDRWVLPRGKLKRAESAVIGARREVVEETGHRVRVREYLGAITYRASGRPKVVQFWRMQAKARPSHGLMKDIAAVEWLPLKAAIRRLSYPLEKLFLGNVGREAIARRKKNKAKKKHKATSKGKRKNKKKSKPPAKAKKKR
jgi:8-oxo-dGTP diphosphatase